MQMHPAEIHLTELQPRPNGIVVYKNLPEVKRNFMLLAVSLHKLLVGFVGHIRCLNITNLNTKLFR